MRLTSPVRSEKHADSWPHETEDYAGPRTVVGGQTSYDAVDHVAYGLDDVVEGDEESRHNPTPHNFPDICFDLAVPAS